MRPSPAVALAMIGGGVLLAEALVTSLLLGLSDTNASPLSAALLAGAGVVALCAARLASRAPRKAAPFCLAALALAGIVYVPVFLSALNRYNESRGPGFPPYSVSLDEVLAPLIWWLAAAAPLVVAAVLAWRSGAGRAAND